MMFLQKKIFSLSWFGFFMIVGFLLQSCAFFKVDKLKPDVVAKIPIGSKNGLELPAQDGVVYEVPLRVGSIDNYLIISEPSQNRIKIFKDNQLQTILSSFKNRENDLDNQEQDTAEQDSDFISTQVKFFLNEYLDIPEKIVTGKNKDFFVVNYIHSNLVGKNQSGQGFYKILHFGVDGEYYGMIGRGGQMELPFESVVWLDTDSEGLLWVLYQHMGDYVLDRYQNSKVVYSSNSDTCVNILFNEKEKQNKKQTLSCERILPFYDGKRILYYGKAEASIEKKESKDETENHLLSYRKLAFFDLEKNETSMVFDEFSEDHEYLALAITDSVYMWNPSDPSRLRVSVYDLEGSKQTNLQPEFLGNRSAWKSIYYRLDSSLFGIRIANSQLFLYRWK